MHKIKQSGGFLRRILGPLLKTGLPLIGNALKPLAKSVLMPLQLTAAASAVDATIHNKMFGHYKCLNIIYGIKKYFDIIKISKTLEESGILIKDVSQIIEAKEQQWRKRTKRMIYWNVIRHFRCHFIMESINR